MALSPSILSGLIRAAMIADPRIGAIDDSALPADQKALSALCDAFAGAVVAHILSAAVVTTPPGVAVVVAVPAGTGATVAPGIGAIT